MTHVFIVSAIGSNPLFFFDGLGWTWTWGLGLGLDNKDFLKNAMRIVDTARKLIKCLLSGIFEWIDLDCTGLILIELHLSLIKTMSFDDILTKCYLIRHQIASNSIKSLSPPHESLALSRHILRKICT